MIVGAMLAASCGTEFVPGAPQAEQTSQRGQDYRDAVRVRDPVLVTRFLQAHPTSRDSASLLNQMPPEVLAAVPRSAVMGLSADVKQQLRARVREQFAIPLANLQTESSPSSASDSYDG